MFSPKTLTHLVNYFTFAVKIHYKTNKLEKQLTEPRAMVKAYGYRAKKVNQRMKEFISADNLEAMNLIPAARCHPLKGTKKGEWAVDISKNYRIVFEPNMDPLPENKDGSLDLKQITEIHILRIEDYH